jgi:hypothetical protein
MIKRIAATAILIIVPVAWGITMHFVYTIISKLTKPGK